MADKITLEVNMANLSEDEREELMKLVGKSKKKKAWKPKNHEKYYVIKTNGAVCEINFYDGSLLDIRCYSIGNCFKTKKEAEFMAEKLKVIAELKRFAEENNESEIDWDDKRQLKYCFYFDHGLNKILFHVDNVWHDINCIYFTSEKIARKAIAAVGEDRIKKYLFGVE